MSRRPDYRITIDGQTLSPEFDARLSSLTLRDCRGDDSDQLDIVISDHDGRVVIPPRGAKILLALGWQDTGLVDRGTYIVDEVEHSGPPDVLTIRARAADMAGTLPGKRSESWHEKTLGDVVATIAGRHGLQPRAAAELAATTIAHIDQTDESDMHFLTRLGRRYDAIAAVKAGYLLFTPASSGTAASGQQIPALQLRRQDGDQHTYSLTERESHFTGVIAQWHDPDQAELVDVLVGSDENPKRLRENFSSAADAQAAAKGEWQRVKRAGATFTLMLAEGRPDVYPETPAALNGWKPDIDAAGWIVNEVTHNLGDLAYTCTLQLEVNAPKGKA